MNSHLEASFMVTPEIFIQVSFSPTERIQVKQALWTFVDQEGVEPTNNAAERALRRGVIWRKHSFGTQSKTGTVFVERILTTVMTLRQQKRNVLDYLTTTCKAVTLGIPSPTLLPYD